MFPQEFLVDLNGTKAAGRCGYSKKTARQAGARLLSNVNIQKAIRELMEKRQERLEITADKWLRELAICGFSDMQNYLTIDADSGSIRAKGFEEMPPNASRAIEVVEEDRVISELAKDGKDRVILHDKFKFKLHSKLRALEIIGEHLGFIKRNSLELPGLENALYELSEKFLPAVRAKAKTRSDEPK